MPKTRLKKQQPQQPVVVVAGAAGFVGSHLSEALIKSGAKVIGLDDLATGSIANMASFHRHPNFDFVECNVNRMIPEELYSRRITHIIHAMGLDTHAPNKSATLASLLAGSFATKNLLDLAVKRGSVFLLTSSINVYEGLASSTSLNNYFGATQHQKAQYSLYEAKRYSEGLCQMYAEEYNLDVRVARLSTVYGPRMDLCDDSFLDTLIQQTLDEKDLIVDEEGSQEIHLTYIDDAVYGLIKLLFAEGDKYYQSIYPIVSPEKTSVISVAYTLRTFLPPGREVQFVPRQYNYQFDPPSISFDRTQQDLDWEPEVSLTDGLRMTIESFRKGTSQAIRRHVIGRSLFATVPPHHDHDGSEGSVHGAVGVTMHDGSESENDKPKPFTSKRVAAKKTIKPGSGSQPTLPFRGNSGVVEKPKEEASTPEQKQDGFTSGRQKSPTKSTPSYPNSPRSTGQLSEHGSDNKKSWWRKMLFLVVLIGLYGLLGRPLIHTVAHAAAGGWDIQRGVAAAKSLDFMDSEQRFQESSGHFADAQQSFSILAGSSKLLGLGEKQQELERSLTAISLASDGLAHLSKAAAPWPNYLENVWPDEDKEATDAQSNKEFAYLVADTRKSLTYTREQLLRAQQAVPAGSQSMVAGASIAHGQETIGGEVKSLSGWLRYGLSQAQLYLSQGEQLLEVLPTVLGEDGRKSYLVMFQNNNELRPTGGFMGSYGLITVDQGKMTEFVIDDIYNPDGQLKSTQAAPEPLQRLFKYDNVTLRDANWSADVPTSAAMIEDLYRQATGTDVDGVFFMTTRAIIPLLAALGPIHLENFNETVTADNFTELAQRHSNVGFVPGSTGKRDFLGVLAEAVMARVSQGNNSDMLLAGRAMMQSLADKEIQLYFENPAVAALVDLQDWSGRTKQTNGDYLRVVDANIGANKSNYFVTRSTHYAVNVDRNSHLQGVVTLEWNHSGTSGTWPGGDYKSYVRVYAPKGAQLLKSNDFDVDTLDVSVEHDKQVFGGYVTVPYGSKKSVSLTYNLPHDLGLLESSGNYQLLWQKQSGLGDEALTVEFNTPSFISVHQVSDGGTVGSDKRIMWNQSAATNDQDFGVTFSQ